MSADVVKQLFDPYFTTKGDAGTGLGVPQVVAFMRASGGSVCVSTEPGVGTCFDLRFPVADHGAPADRSDQWRQVDRWVNEGGSWRFAEASHERRGGDWADQRLRHPTTAARNRRRVGPSETDAREGEPEQGGLIATPPRSIMRAAKPCVAAPAAGRAS
jgi:hypothetical protein